MGVELFKHNKTAYEKVQEVLKENDRACVVHATGTGKSFIALKLIYDFLEENPDRKIVFLAPLSGIGEQIKEHISTMDLPEETFENVEFNNYQSLIAKTREEIESIEYDLLILDEFHHIGAPEWTKRLEILIDSNPNSKIFGMSATSVRAFGTKREEDVAETFFKGNVASRFDLAEAIATGVLPEPNYHSALTILEGDCEELESKIDNGFASPEEKEEYKRILADIRKKVAEGESADELIRNNIKPTGKYIYFCPKGSDLSVLQENIRNIMSNVDSDSIEFYQVHSSEQTDKINNLNANSFYHNTTIDGKDASGKLRIMFAIDMYNEGIHVPDIDGVIMGRATKSDITFYQQLGRALAVRKKADGSDERIEPPLVIDLMGNFKEIKRLYLRVEARKHENESKQRERNPYEKHEKDKYEINFGLSEEIIDLLSSLEQIRTACEFKLSDSERLKELCEYIEKNGRLPKWDEQTQFSDGRVMSNWVAVNKKDIIELSEKGNELAKKIVEQFRLDPEEQFLIYIEEALTFCQKNKGIPKWDETSITFSNGTQMFSWLQTYKDKILELSQQGNELAKKLYGYYLPTNDELFDLHVDEMYQFIKKNGGLPKKSLNLKFSDGKLMSAWLNKNKSKIAQYASDGSEKAKLITEQQQKSSKGAGKSIRTIERIKEILDYYDKNGTLPSDDVRFESGANIMQWLKAKPNKDAIQELINQKNPEALKLIEIQEQFTSSAIFEGKLKEAYTYIKAHSKVPSNVEVKFSDGSDMYSWLLTYKPKIIEYAQSENELAKAIVDVQYDPTIVRSGSEDIYVARIHELLEFYKENGRLPKSSDKVRFTDGRIMFSWMNDNKDAINEKGQLGDELSKTAYELIYRNSDAGRFELKCSELLQYYSQASTLPTREEGKFSDGSSMYHFISNMAKKIYENRDTNPVVNQLAEILLANNPNYFNKVKAFKQAEEMFDASSEFKKATQKGVKKTNGK